ncbi:hypothetical protein LOC67_25655 [Stieleria sp. JC731]|uniref:hypothetical protein n=1 Tax=Pirellulaceae TaxID=2691357 RepID=UPI001E45CDF3|nr:hypothetical protein [Stieleria sp. JC731]MCC9603952.1 hypothetical protein [Stieleria sp. JC731]
MSRGNYIAGFAALLMFIPFAPVWSQTVQLPTFQTFSYSGSVLVPDRGSVSLGSVRRSASGRSSRGFGLGPLGSHAGGATNSIGSASVHVTIIDHDAIDRQIRGLPPRGVSSPKSSGAAVASNALEKIDVDAEGKALVRYARQKFREGDTGKAFDAYQLAIRKLTPRLADLAKSEMDRVIPSAQQQVFRRGY